MSQRYTSLLNNNFMNSSYNQVKERITNKFNKILFDQSKAEADEGLKERGQITTWYEDIERNAKSSL